MYFKSLIIIILIFLGGCSAGYQLNQERVKILTSDTEHVLTVEIAETQEERALGLMGRKNLDQDTGMLFLYGKDTKPVIWMKNMLIPLDILFIDSDLKINHIEKNVPPCKEIEDDKCLRYSSPYASSMVLELPSSYTDSHEVGVGDQLEF